MANQEHHAVLKQGVHAWNQWRQEHPDIQPNLIGADLSGANLRGANFSDANPRSNNPKGANFQGANLRGADFRGADLRGAELIDADLSKANLSGVNLSGADLEVADLSEADLTAASLSGADLTAASLRKANLRRVILIEAHLGYANLSRADLREADLRGADLNNASLRGADLSEADLSGANLSNAVLNEANLKSANLSRATLVETKLTKATLTRCSIYGISVWNVQLEEAIQKDLVITQEDEPTITVDNLKIAQFIYLLLNNAEIRDVIDTIAKKAVLILGRFTPERKAILEAIREMLRQKGYLPILFDFDKPQSQDLTETISTLAHLAKFVIVDLTSPSSAPHEVMAIAPHCIVPIQPLFHPDDVTKHEYAMFRDLQRRYHWVLPIHHYQDLEDLLNSLQAKVIAPAERKVQELEGR